jgi:hypothetical protein
MATVNYDPAGEGDEYNGAYDEEYIMQMAILEAQEISKVEKEAKEEVYLSMATMNYDPAGEGDEYNGAYDEDYMMKMAILETQHISNDEKLGNLSNYAVYNKSTKNIRISTTPPS